MKESEEIPPASEGEIRELLLGRLEGEKRERIEGRLLDDADFGEIVSAIEEELIDDYNTSGLSDEDRRRFEQHFLVTPERRQRVGSTAEGAKKARLRRGDSYGVASAEARQAG